MLNLFQSLNARLIDVLHHMATEPTPEDPGMETQPYDGCRFGQEHWGQLSTAEGTRSGNGAAASGERGDLDLGGDALLERRHM